MVKYAVILSFENVSTLVGCKSLENILSHYAELPTAMINGGEVSETVEVFRGENVSLVCGGQGQPHPNTTWTSSFGK